MKRIAMAIIVGLLSITRTGNSAMLDQNGNVANQASYSQFERSAHFGTANLSTQPRYQNIRLQFVCTVSTTNGEIARYYYSPDTKTYYIYIDRRNATANFSRAHYYSNHDQAHMERYDANDRYQTQAELGSSNHTASMNYSDGRSDTSTTRHRKIATSQSAETVHSRTANQSLQPQYHNIRLQFVSTVATNDGDIANYYYSPDTRAYYVYIEQGNAYETLSPMNLSDRNHEQAEITNDNSNNLSQADASNEPRNTHESDDTATVAYRTTIDEQGTTSPQTSSKVTPISFLSDRRPLANFPEYALPWCLDLMNDLQGGCDDIFALAFVAPFWGIAYLCGIDGFGGYTKLILIIVGIISITYHIVTGFSAFVLEFDGDDW